MDWDRRYADRHTPWDLRGPTAPLQALLAGDRLWRWGVPAGGRVAVPGCGRGHDLRVWAAAGLRAVGFDVVPAAVAEARALLALNRAAAEVLRRDVLGLAAEFSRAFDVVYDYTCFCALPPHLRGAYGREVAAILRPGGVLLHLAFPMLESHTGRAGPPYLIRSADLDAAFGAVLDPLERFAAEGSPPERAGAEEWFAFRRPAP